jgi:hypothetical protein
MRKIVTSQPVSADTAPGPDWLDLTGISRVEVTSEEHSHPVEAALLLGVTDQGWRAAQPGEQMLRLVFDKPVSLTRVVLQFDEHLQTRTQEFELNWLPDQEQHWREIVRQQYNFSPPGTVRELEDYRLELHALRAIELRIVPDISGSGARASLTSWRLASVAG